MDYRLVARPIADKLHADLKAGAIGKIDLDLISTTLRREFGTRIAVADLEQLEIATIRRVVELA